MKEKQKEAVKDDLSGEFRPKMHLVFRVLMLLICALYLDDAGMRKSFSFTFKQPALSGTVDKVAANKKMKQTSMKDFMAGSSSRPIPETSTKFKVSSPTKPKPAWNASAGSPSKARQSVKPQSTLSTLSIALEKLAMPRPVRPNTSMGFASTSGEGKEKERAVDDGAVGRKRDGVVNLSMGGVGGRGLKRSATVGDDSFSTMVGREDKTPSSSKSAVIAEATVGHKPTSEPSTTTGSTAAPSSPPKAGNSSPTRPSVNAPSVGSSIRQSAATTTLKSNTFADRGAKVFGAHGSGSGILSGGRSGIVIGNGALGRKVSKKTSLPSVMDSPVKGGSGWNPMSEVAEDEPSVRVDDGDASMRSAAGLPTAINDEGSEMGKSREKSTVGWKQNASMRASMASQSLTQSLSGMPRTPSKGSMGPPRTPGRSASSTYPTVASGSKDGRDEEKRKVRDETVLALKSAPSALGRVRSGTDGHVGSSRSARIFAQEKIAEPEAASEVIEEKGNSVLNVLKECIIFVDVRTDGGDDAGSLFVDMLKGMGARVGELLMLILI